MIGHYTRPKSCVIYQKYSLFRREVNQILESSKKYNYALQQNKKNDLLLVPMFRFSLFLPELHLFVSVQCIF